MDTVMDTRVEALLLNGIAEAYGYRRDPWLRLPSDRLLPVARQIVAEEVERLVNDEHGHDPQMLEEAVAMVTAHCRCLHHRDDHHGPLGDRNCSVCPCTAFRALEP